MARARCCRRQVKQKQPTIADWVQSSGQAFEKAKRGAPARLEALADKATSEGEEREWKTENYPPSSNKR